MEIGYWQIQKCVVLGMKNWYLAISSCQNNVLLQWSPVVSATNAVGRM